MKTHVIKIKLRKLHKYIGFTFSIFILHLTITGILLTYPKLFNINEKYTNNFYLLKKYNMQTYQDVMQFNHSKKEIISIKNSLYLDRKFIDNNKEETISAIYHINNKILYILNKSEIIIYEFELIEDVLEIKDILYLSNSENFIQIGIDQKYNIYLKNNKHEYMIDKENSYKKVEKLIHNKLVWSKANIVNEDIAKIYLKIHQGNGVSILRILTELHNGKFFGSIFTFILFISSLSLIFLTLSSFVFGTNFMKKTRKGNL
jgi:hypothetical protein